MKKPLFALVLALCVLALYIAPSGAFWHGSVGSPPSIPTLVAGTAIPASQTPLQPSASRWDPSCLDATWGTGCNVATHTCTAPTVGTPLETCTPPKQFIVTGGTGNGTTSTITYTSYAHYTYPAATPLLISSATNALWNTPNIGVTSFTGGAGSCAPTCTFTLGFTALAGGNTPFIVGKQVNVGLVTGTDFVGVAGFGWPSFTNLTFTGLAMPQGTVYVNVPITGGSGSGGTVNIVAISSGFITHIYRSIAGTGYQDGDVIGIDTTNFPGLQSLTSFNATVTNSQVTSPNGALTVASATPTSVTFSTGSHQLTGTLGSLNSLGNNGSVQEPWIVTSSTCNIGGVPEHCSVTFPNPNTCASACVSASTHIIAGQEDDTILAWHYGEDIPNSLQNGDVRICGIPKHISPITSVTAMLDGGPPVTVTTPIVDPWGLGKSTLSAPATNYSYCYHFAASSVSDGMHEVRMIACATVGWCHILSSVITADATSGSTTLTANAHGLSSWKSMGITKSFDAAFQNYDWRDYLANPINTSVGTAITSGSSNGTTLTLGFAQPSNVPTLHTGEVINVSATVNSNSCPITGGTPTGGVLTVTYSGGCNFPTGSSVNIASVTLGTTPITSWSYNSGTGVISITTASAQNGVSPTTGADVRTSSINQYNLTLLGAGAGLASLQGVHTLVSSSAGGTVLNFQDSTGLVISSTSTGTLTGNALTWNTLATLGAPVVTGGTSSITLSSLGTSVWGSGGTISANWNGDCTVSSASSGSVSCSALEATATWSSGGTLNSSGNLYCTIGGAGDWPPPYPTNSALGGQMTGETFQLQASTSSTNCSGNANTTACILAPCGAVASQNETLWLTRKDSGLDERHSTLATLNANGSFFVTTNAGGTIQKQDAYVNSWNQTSQPAGCLGPVGPAGATLAAYTGPYCNNMYNALNVLAPTARGLAQTLTNPSGCLTFTNASNAGTGEDFYAGEPVEFTGLDTNASAALTNWGVYWIKTLVGDDITLTTTPGGACINETPSGIIGGASGTGTAGFAALYGDIGMDSVLLACDTTNNANQAPCSPSNPQTYLAGTSWVTPPSPASYAKSGFFTIGPDTAAGSTFPATKSEISLDHGISSWFSSSVSQGGKIQVTVDTKQHFLSLTSAVSVNKTTGILASTSGSVQTGGTLPGGATCPSTCETLNFTTLAAGAGAWQLPTSTGGPGQGVMITGVTGTGGTWTCGTALLPCHVIDATTSSISFVNTLATGTCACVAGVITPASIVLEFAQGTFAHDPTTNPNGYCTDTSGVSLPTKNNLACVALYTPGSGFRATGTSNAFPFNFVTGNGASSNIAVSSNCLPFDAGQSAPNLQGSPLGANTTPLTLTFGSPGTTNDILELTGAEVGAVGTTWPFQAFNDCGTGPFVFANNPFQLEGINNAAFTDSWSHDRDVTFASWHSNFDGRSGDLAGNANGAVYVTNGNLYGSAVDVNSYAWGSNAAYNGGVCANQTLNIVSVRCVGSQQSTPFSLGGSNYPGTPYGAYWTTITDAWHLDGVTRDTCTINGVTGNCITSASKVFAVGHGLIPSSVVPGFVVHINCGMATSGHSMLPQTQGNGLNEIALTLDNSLTPARFTTTPIANISTSCLISNNPTVTWFNGQHIDMLFWIIGGGITPSPFALSWTYFNDTVSENFSCPACVNMQGLFYQGGNYLNQAWEDDDIEVGGIPIPSQQFNINGQTWAGGFDFHNYVVRNTNIWGKIVNPSDATSSLDDLFYIRNSGGSDYVGFPSGGSNLNLFGGGFAGGSNVVNAGSAGSQNMTIWPSLTGGVDINGVPLLPGASGPANLGACPWYCTATDTGVGSI